MIPRHTADEDPAHERREGSEMHDGCVGACHAIGDGNELRAALLGCFDEAHDLREGGPLPGRGDLYPQRGPEIGRARGHGIARRGRDRAAFAGDQRRIQGRMSRQDPPIRAEPFPRRDEENVARHQALEAPAFGRAIGQGDARAPAQQCQQTLDRQSGPAAQLPVEISADQKEKQQCRRGVEVGVLGVDPGLVQADRAGQCDADGDRHVHVRAAGLERLPGRREEGAAGISDDGQRDRCRKPVEQCPRGLAHRGRSRPDGDREQHDVRGAEACDGKAPEQLARLLVLCLKGGGGLKGRGREAKCRDQSDMSIGIGGGSVPSQREPARGKVDPSLRHRGIAREKALDQPDAGRAIEPLDQQVERERAVAAVAGEYREIGVQELRATGTGTVETCIERAQSHRVDDRVGAGAAGAAESIAVVRPQNLAAMGADARRCRGGPGRRQGDAGHSRNIRLVSAK